MSHNPYKIVSIFEEIVADYCGSRYAVAVDNATNGLFLCMKYLKIEKQEITIPARTFMSVPCAIIHAGNKVKFNKNHHAMQGKKLKGQYQLEPFPIWDSALTFKKDMYIDGQFQCLSFSGPHKFLKLGKGGMILTDSKIAYDWLKRAAYFGRHPIDHMIDNFDMLGWNYYMLPEIAARGAVLMLGVKDHNEDLALEYQDLSGYKVYTEVNR